MRDSGLEAMSLDVQSVRSPGSRRRLRVAQLAPLVETIPPVRYGGTEQVIATLAEELVRRGHDVTLFASGESRTSARLVPVVPEPLWRSEFPLTGIAIWAQSGTCSDELEPRWARQL